MGVCEVLFCVGRDVDGCSGQSLCSEFRTGGA
jgi:hypothetical protein